MAALIKRSSMIATKTCFAELPSTVSLAKARSELLIKNEDAELHAQHHVGCRRSVANCEL